MKTYIEISSILGEEKKFLEELEKVLRNAGCCEEDIMDTKTAAAEACLNAMEHGNRLDPDLSVNIHFQVIDDTIIIDVYDHGKGAELRALTGKAPAKDEKFRGWGLHLISRLVNEWEHFYKPEDKLFCVRMKKIFRRGR